MMEPDTLEQRNEYINAVSPVSHTEKTSVHPRSKFFSTMLNQKNKIVGNLYNFYQNSDPPIFSPEAIWVLGDKFELVAEYEDESYKWAKGSRKILLPHTNRMLHMAKENFIYFSYRRSFQPICLYNSTSDIGWGCMVRTGQMILAKALLQSYGDARITNESQNDAMSPYRSILRLFMDAPGKPFSIHSIIEANQNLHGVDKKVINRGGEWFAPTKISLVLMHLVFWHKPSNLIMHVPKTGAVYIEEILNLCENEPGEQNGEYIEENGEWSPMFLLIPARIGIEKVNESYIPHLKEILESPYSVGIIGGKPRASLYFIGYQENHIIYLDPHVVQSTVDPDETFSDRVLDTYRCKNVKKMSISKIDPSMSIGFFFASKDEFLDFVDRYNTFASEYPVIFSIEEESPDYVHNDNSLYLESFVTI
eukprot:TRINITY_DN1297_c0_g1_i2.p1 TRINITY_DN1297_c0_g1~~TRINITY_DN1297_c0_g1_i2.p1  ORF type:complete len:421 (+),score=81.77 TRINITY_DN1297_c0_g1_i2:705-1967(+)